MEITHQRSRQGQLKKVPLTSKLNYFILITALLQIAGQQLNSLNLTILKPIPIMLMIWYAHNFKRSPPEASFSWLEFGLMLSLIGDVLLMFSESFYFMLGTAFFLLAQIVYMITIAKGHKIREIAIKHQWCRRAGFLGVGALFVFLNVTFWDKFPLRILFVSYTSMLSLQAIISMSRYEKTNCTSFWLVLAGIFLFISSDSLIAFTKFNHIISMHVNALIMATYYLAQYLIMRGVIAHNQLKQSTNKTIK